MSKSKMSTMVVVNERTTSGIVVVHRDTTTRSERHPPVLPFKPGVPLPMCTAKKGVARTKNLSKSEITLQRSTLLGQTIELTVNYKSLFETHQFIHSSLLVVAGDRGYRCRGRIFQVYEGNRTTFNFHEQRPIRLKYKFDGLVSVCVYFNSQDFRTVAMRLAYAMGYLRLRVLGCAKNTHVTKPSWRAQNHGSR